MTKKYMKGNLFFIFLILWNILGFAVSCTSNNDDLVNEKEENGSQNVNPQNKELVGTKWILTDQDYSIGDDYVGIHDYTINIYFYSETEGLVYCGQKDNYSDLGESSYRIVSHFNFNMKDGTVEITYITSEIPEVSFSSLIVKGNEIVADGIKFQRDEVSSDDYDWLATLHGKTGDCLWYHDLQKTLYIVGEGKMADYSFFDTTPWANRTFNILEVREGVTSIGNNAFACKSLGEVKLPYSSLTRIGNNAFSGSCIPEVYLSDNIAEIGNGAFSNCSYLYKVNLPKNIEIIGESAFSDCNNVDLSDTKKLKEIGKYAFAGCQINNFTDSKVLGKVGDGAFTDLAVNKLVLPNSLRTIGHLAFNGSFTEIHIGTGLMYVTGTPFCTSKTLGNLYVNLTIPLPLNRLFIDPSYGWVLYVPKGCQSAYSNADYWKDFKNVIEDDSLGSGNEDNDEDNDSGSSITIPETYSNAGKTYKWIKVESSFMPTYYIMQTELDACSHFRVGENGDIGILNTNGDVAVIKAQMRDFLDKIKQVTGIQMRLPTREEWIYAAKGGNKSLGYTYSGSNNIDEVAWYSKNSYSKIQNFAQKQPNELGIYDMNGNYAELTNDNATDYANVDGYYYGGCYKDDASDCTVISGKPGVATGNVPGSLYKEKNAYDARYITVRLVFTAPE